MASIDRRRSPHCRISGFKTSFTVNLKLLSMFPLERRVNLAFITLIRSTLVICEAGQRVIAHPPASGPGVRSAGDGIENGLERSSSGSHASGVDDGPHVGLAVRGPHGALSICDLALNDGGPEGSFGGIVRCALLRCTILPGSSPGRQTLAPAGSTRGGSGGDEWSEALREKAPSGGQRTVRAATRVNTEQASKQPMWEPTRPNNGEGRSQRGSERDTHPTIPPG